MNIPRLLRVNLKHIAKVFGLLCALLVLASCGQGITATTPTGQSFHPELAANQPSRLVISSLGMNAPIMPVGLDQYGAMQAPGAGHPASDPIWATSFWWKQGALPGQPGNAVLAGHVDRNDGSRAVFWNLSDIQTGDTILIINQSGQTLTFRVTNVEAFTDPDGGPHDPVIQRVFGPASSANLNLITCYGSWIGTEYNKRLVVFSTLVSGT
ncbi:MAG TPA: class F sortase [Ktedonobacterales bacterium]|nr:class F sortase [Ktedonobacterales bacterium]